jgi:hypothetical protein
VADPSPEAVPRYPLQWPLGWPRTDARRRQSSTFTQKRQAQQIDPADSRRQSYGQVTTHVATSRLEKQLELLGGQDPTLSTNVRLRLDGRPYSDREPEDPGVAVYFRFKGRATVLACDRYKRVADNIAALAAHIDALRRIDRYGVGTIEQALAGYRALPADTAADWRAVFGFAAHETVTAEMVNRAFKERAATAHPDKGGTEVGMAHLNRAREFALQEVRG